MLFANYDEYDLTVLIWAFPKNRQANLTAARRKVLSRLKRDLDVEMKVKYGK